MKLLLIGLGFISLALGCVGIVLPILPTTPFLLLAAFCFAKSSKRLNDWFKNTKLYHDNLQTFSKGQGMTWKAKLRIMGSVTIVMAAAFIAMQNTLPGRICLAVVWTAHVIAFCFFIKTCPEEQSVRKIVEEPRPYDD